MSVLRAGAAVLSLLTAGCLEPLASDDIDLGRIFGDPALAPDDVPHVEDLPAFARNVELFPTSVPYLQGFASGEEIWYWRFPNPAELIVPYYFVIDQSSNPISVIIDDIPGDPGYSPWWRRVVVRTTERYAGEHIWSRAAVDAGVRTGILSPPEETTGVFTCPVVRRDVRVRVDLEGGEVGAGWVFYRNQRVSWLVFDTVVEVPIATRKMPKAPMFVLQRVNQQTPLFEFGAGFDMDGDGQLTASNNIFRANNGDPGYSPNWYPVLVRTRAEYVSFDDATETTPIGLTDERQFLGPDFKVTSDLVIPPIERNEEILDACPIQKSFGRL